MHGNWNAKTFESGEVDRVLWVRADSMTDALLACRLRGVLVAKLSKMETLRADIVRLTTLARPEAVN